MRLQSERRARRFGLILDDANGTLTTIEGNVFRDNNEFGILLQGQAFDPPTTGNTFEDNGSGDVQDVGANTFPVRTEEFKTSF